MAEFWSATPRLLTGQIKAHIRMQKKSVGKGKKKAKPQRQTVPIRYADQLPPGMW